MTIIVLQSRMADGVGFEPTKGYEPLPVFKTGAFNHSATHPGLRARQARATLYALPASLKFTRSLPNPKRFLRCLKRSQAQQRAFCCLAVEVCG